MDLVSFQNWPRKKCGMLFLLLTSSIWACAAKSEQNSEVLIIGYSNHPPYSYQEDGQIKGIYHDIIKTVLDRMPSYKSRLGSAPWKRALKMVESKDAQGVFPPHIFPTERPYLVRYSSPIMTEEVSIYCNVNLLEENKTIDSDNEWPQAFKEYLFVYTRGVLLGEKRFWDDVEVEGIDVVEVEGVETALSLLYSGRADCHVNDSFTVDWVLQNNKLLKLNQASKSIKKLTTLYESAGRLGVNEFDGVEDFVREFNVHLQAIQEEGIQQQIIDAYWD
jgi:polar amino acid transport system substrate-binding protein